MSHQILLHQWEISPFCHKVRLLLACKGLNYQVQNYNGLSALRARSLSAVGKLPVLEIDGQRIQDSSRIFQYLEEHYPEPVLLPSDPVQRAEALFWEDWADEVLFFFEVYYRNQGEGFKAAVAHLCAGRPEHEKWLFAPLLKLDFLQKLRAQGLGRQKPTEVRAAFLGHLKGLETILGARAWLVGEQISIADIAVAAQIKEIQRTSPLRTEIAQHPQLMAWLARIDASTSQP